MKTLLLTLITLIVMTGCGSETTVASTTTVTSTTTVNTIDRVMNSSFEADFSDFVINEIQPLIEGYYFSDIDPTEESSFYEETECTDQGYFTTTTTTSNGVQNIVVEYINCSQDSEIVNGDISFELTSDTLKVQSNLNTSTNDNTISKSFSLTSHKLDDNSVLLTSSGSFESYSEVKDFYIELISEDNGDTVTFGDNSYLGKNVISFVSEDKVIF